MSLTIKTEGDFEKLSTGLYAGTCYRIIDMGTTEQEYEGVTSKKKRVHITFEVNKSLDINILLYKVIVLLTWYGFVPLCLGASSSL